MKGKKKVLPLITDATGIFSKTLKKYLNNIPGEHEKKELQKTATLSNTHVKMKVKQNVYG